MYPYSLDHRSHLRHSVDPPHVSTVVLPPPLLGTRSTPFPSTADPTTGLLHSQLIQTLTVKVLVVNLDSSVEQAILSDVMDLLKLVLMAQEATRTGPVEGDLVPGVEALTAPVESRKHHLYSVNRQMTSSYTNDNRHIYPLLHRDCIITGRPLQAAV